MDTIQIRALRAQDADDVWKIFKTITKSPISIDYAQAVQEHVASSASASFVAECGGRVVGFMICTVIACGFGLLDKSAWITMLGVDPDYMGQGIGKGLAKAIFSHCKDKGISNIYSSVLWDAGDLLSFFKTLGFGRCDFVNLNKSLEPADEP